LNCIIYQAIKKIKDNQDQCCADIITNVINGSRAASSVPIDHISKAKVITEFIISNGKLLASPSHSSSQNPSPVTNDIGGPEGWTEEKHEDGTVVYTNPEAPKQSKAASSVQKENKALVLAEFFRSMR
jgi:hypothetical protein